MTKNRQAVLLSRINHTNHNIPPASIDYFVSQIQRSHADMTIEVVRPFGIFSVLKVVLDRTLRAVLVLRGYVIEWVLVKGLEETFEELNPTSLNKLDRSEEHT